MSFNFGERETVIANRQAFIKSINIDYEYTRNFKVLNSDVITVICEKTIQGKKPVDLELRTDAVITNIKGIFFSLLLVIAFHLSLSTDKIKY